MADVVEPSVGIVRSLYDPEWKPLTERRLVDQIGVLSALSYCLDTRPGSGDADNAAARNILDYDRALEKVVTDAVAVMEMPKRTLRAMASSKSKQASLSDFFVVCLRFFAIVFAAVDARAAEREEEEAAAAAERGEPEEPEQAPDTPRSRPKRTKRKTRKARGDESDSDDKGKKGGGDDDDLDIMAMDAAPTSASGSGTGTGSGGSGGDGDNGRPKKRDLAERLILALFNAIKATHPGVLAAAKAGIETVVASGFAIRQDLLNDSVRPIIFSVASIEHMNVPVLKTLVCLLEVVPRSFNARLGDRALQLLGEWVKPNRPNPTQNDPQIAALLLHLFHLLPEAPPGSASKAKAAKKKGKKDSGAGVGSGSGADDAADDGKPESGTRLAALVDMTFQLEAVLPHDMVSPYRKPLIKVSREASCVAACDFGETKGEGGNGRL